MFICDRHFKKGNLKCPLPPFHPFANCLVSPQVKPQGSKVPKGLAPPLDPSDPFADDNREKREVEAMAKKFENKYVSDGASVVQE